MTITLLDCETTGLDPFTREIIEIAAIKFNSDTHQEIDRFESKIKPTRPQDIDEKAQAVNGYNDEEWEDAPDLLTVMEDFATFSRDTTLMAYNYHFDLSFLEVACKQTGTTLQISRHKIDLLSMAFAMIPHRKVTSWSMKTICTVLRLPPEPKMHRAMNGVEAEFRIYKEIMRGT